MPITHSFVSVKSDGGDATLVRPSDWNADHTGGITHTYYGRTTVGGSVISMAAATTYMRKITLAADGMMVAIRANIKYSSEDISGPVAALFSDNAGAPNLILAEAGDVQTVHGHLQLGTAARWFHWGITAWLTAGDYWIGVCDFKAAGPGCRLAYDATGGAGRTFPSRTDFGGAIEEPANNTVTTTTEDYSISASVLT